MPEKDKQRQYFLGTELAKQGTAGLELQRACKMQEYELVLLKARFQMHQLSPPGQPVLQFSGHQLSILGFNAVDNCSIRVCVCDSACGRAQSTQVLSLSDTPQSASFSSVVQAAGIWDFPWTLPSY